MLKQHFTQNTLQVLIKPKPMAFQATVVSEQARQLVSETLQQVTRGPEASALPGSSQEGALKDDSPSYMESSPTLSDSTHGEALPWSCYMLSPLVNVRLYSVVTILQSVFLNMEVSFWFNVLKCKTISLLFECPETISFLRVPMGPWNLWVI